MLRERTDLARCEPVNSFLPNDHLDSFLKKRRLTESIVEDDRTESSSQLSSSIYNSYDSLFDGNSSSLGSTGSRSNSLNSSHYTNVSDSSQQPRRNSRRKHQKVARKYNEQRSSSFPVHFEHIPSWASSSPRSKHAYSLEQSDQYSSHRREPQIRSQPSHSFVQISNTYQPQRFTHNRHIVNSNGYKTHHTRCNMSYYSSTPYYSDLVLEWWERSEGCKEAKAEHTYRIDRICSSREDLVLLTTLNGCDIALEPNMFPYDTPNCVEHYTLWSRYDLGHREIQEYVDGWLSAHLPLVRRWQYDDNCGERTIDLFHVHVFIETTPFAFQARKGLEYYPPHHFLS